MVGYFFRVRLFFLRLLPSWRHAREYMEIEAKILKIAALISCPMSGASYEHLQMACRLAASHQPKPTSQALDELFMDIVDHQPTFLAHDFYREYCKKEQ